MIYLTPITPSSSPYGAHQTVTPNPPGPLGPSPAEPIFQPIKPVVNAATVLRPEDQPWRRENSALRTRMASEGCSSRSVRICSRLLQSLSIKEYETYVLSVDPRLLLLQPMPPIHNLRRLRPNHQPIHRMNTPRDHRQPGGTRPEVERVQGGEGDKRCVTEGAKEGWAEFDVEGEEAEGAEGGEGEEVGDLAGLEVAELLAGDCN